MCTVSGMQAQGIEFRHIDLDQALEEAAREEKLVFIDFYTTWCAPCKAMSKNIFPLEEVGELYNKEFVSIKLDAEKAGKAAAAKYQVNSYPTYLFLNPDGEVVFRETGSSPMNMFIELGRNVVVSAQSEYSLSSLKSIYGKNKNNEKFLKMFCSKMIEYGEKPYEAVDQWLRVQNSYPDDHVRVMEFLLDHINYLLVGSKAEEIYTTHKEEFYDIATKAESRQLDRMIPRMLTVSRELALSTGDTTLMKTFLDRWKSLPEERTKHRNTEIFELEYLALKKDQEGYKELAISFLESEFDAKPLKEIRKEDKAYTEREAKRWENKQRPAYYGPSYYTKLEDGPAATEMVELIASVGSGYLKYCSGRRDYRQLDKWIDYGFELIPDSYRMNNLKADMLFRKGEVKDAIAFKEAALEDWPQDDKKLDTRVYELEQMKEQIK